MPKTLIRIENNRWIYILQGKYILNNTKNPEVAEKVSTSDGTLRTVVGTNLKNGSFTSVSSNRNKNGLPHANGEQKPGDETLRDSESILSSNGYASDPRQYNTTDLTRHAEPVGDSVAVEADPAICLTENPSSLNGGSIIYENIGEAVDEDVSNRSQIL